MFKSYQDKELEIYLTTLMESVVSHSLNVYFILVIILFYILSRNLFISSAIIAYSVMQNPKLKKNNLVTVSKNSDSEVAVLEEAK